MKTGMAPRQRLVSPPVFDLLVRDVDEPLFDVRPAVFPPVVPGVASDLRVAEVRLVAAAARGAAVADLRDVVVLASAAGFARDAVLDSLDLGAFAAADDFVAEVFAAVALDFAAVVFAVEAFAVPAVAEVDLLVEPLPVALAGEAAAVLRDVVTALLACEATFPFAALVFFSPSVCDFDRSFFVVLEAFAMLPS